MYNNLSTLLATVVNGIDYVFTCIKAGSFAKK